MYLFVGDAVTRPASPAQAAAVVALPAQAPAVVPAACWRRARGGMLRDLRTDIVCRKLQVARARKDETDGDAEHQRAEHHHGANQTRTLYASISLDLYRS